MGNERQNGLMKGSLLMLSVAALFPLSLSETAAQRVSRAENDDKAMRQFERHLLEWEPPPEDRKNRENSVVNHGFEEDSKMIEGSWVIVEAELGGQKLPDEGIKGIKLILQEGRYRLQNDQGEYKLNPAEKIKAMDIVGREGPNEGKSFLAIYELKGDRLRICYDLAGKTRPKEFKTEAGTQQFLVTYRREKE